MATASHPLNRHLFVADNLKLLRYLDNESVDLICIDPPFAKNQTWVDNLRPPLTDAERRQELDMLASWGIENADDAAKAGIDWPNDEGSAKFKDIWRWENDVHEEWVERIEGDYEALAKVIDATRSAHSEGTAAYLTYMAIRMIEMHRVLKDTGSLYLHCDSTANGYIRMAMDAIFGQSNFRNEIIWKRTSGRSDARRYGRVHDCILFYRKTPDFIWNTQWMEHSPEYVRKAYQHSDNRGQWSAADLTAKGISGGESGKPWRGVDPSTVNRHWTTPTQGGMNDFIIAKNLIPGWPHAYATVQARLDALDSAGLVYWPDKKDGIPRLKRYLGSTKGTAVDDIFSDIRRLEAQSPEKTGYPTQKPVALAERIIKASFNPGDVVLDCFAGCAYVPVAAERNGRQWIACDISPRALTVLRRQFQKFHYVVDGEQSGQEPVLIAAAHVTTQGPHQPPVRTDEDPAPRYDFKEPAERKFKIPTSIIPEPEMLEMLLKLSGYTAWCCGFANRRPDGSIVETRRNFHLDHLAPKSKEGSNQITNHAPMCPAHNIRKNKRRIHLSEYRDEIADTGEMMVDSMTDLINLAWAEQQALDLYAEERMRRDPQMTLRPK